MEIFFNFASHVKQPQGLYLNMTPDQIYHELVLLAEKFDISVSEQNLQSSGFKIRSGFCIVKERKRFIIDKQLTTFQKIDLLASLISSMPHESVYIIPALRDEISKHADAKKGGQ